MADVRSSHTDRLVSYTVAPVISWAILPGGLRKIFSPRPIPPTFMTEFPTSLMLRPKQLRAAAEESALLVPTAAQFGASYPNIGCPVRILHGAEDQVIESKQARDLHQALPRSNLRLVQNAGHMVTYADVAAIAKAASFLA
jgi:pimeloyl-ACP methyl ester carboxylesterase